MFLRYRLQSGKLAELLLPQTWTVGFARNYDFRHRSLLILRFFELINFLYIWPSELLDFGSNLGFEEILLKFQTTPGFEPPSMLDNGLGSPLSQLPILKVWYLISLLIGLHPHILSQVLILLRGTAMGKRVILIETPSVFLWRLFCSLPYVDYYFC